VELTGDSEGVIVALGSRFGGYTLYIREVNSPSSTTSSGFPPEQRISAPAPVEPAPHGWLAVVRDGVPPLTSGFSDQRSIPVRWR
jgi:hypothetical protein